MTCYREWFAQLGKRLSYAMDGVMSGKCWLDDGAERDGAET